MRWGDARLADGTTQALTLAQAGIAGIDLIPDAAWTLLLDGSMIKGEASFTGTNGTTGPSGKNIVGNAVFARDGQGYRVVQEVSTDAAGARTAVTSGFAASGDLAFRTTSVTSANGLSRTVRHDLDGDGVTDTIRTVVTSIAANGTRTQTSSDFTGSDLATAALAESEVVTTSANGGNVTRLTDSTGGGWFDGSEWRLAA